MVSSAVEERGMQPSQEEAAVGKCRRTLAGDVASKRHLIEMVASGDRSRRMQMSSRRVPYQRLCDHCCQKVEMPVPPGDCRIHIDYADD